MRIMERILSFLLLLFLPWLSESIGLIRTTDSGYDAGGPDPVCWEGYSSAVTDGASLVFNAIFGLNKSESRTNQSFPNPLVSNFSLGRLEVQSSCPDGVDLKVQPPTAFQTDPPRTFTNYHYSVGGSLDLGELLKPGSNITTDRGTSEIGIKVRSSSCSSTMQFLPFRLLVYSCGASVPAGVMSSGRTGLL